jgi:hypothetical protein
MVKAPVLNGMVSYLVTPTVEGLQTATSVGILDLNPPQSVLTPEQLAEFNRGPQYYTIARDDRQFLSDKSVALPTPYKRDSDDFYLVNVPTTLNRVL